MDGQQRLSTLAQFYNGRFDDSRVFRLSGVDPRWQGRTYDSLTESDQLRLDDTPLRSMVIQQLQPNDHSSIYLIFERLNTGGTQLNPMEIRKAVYHGAAYDFLAGLNDVPAWRDILDQQRRDRRLRDVELVLRVLALSERWTGYVKPMKGFLNRYMEDLAHAAETRLDDLGHRFTEGAAHVVDALGPRPFHIRTRLNAAALDGFMGSVVALPAPHSAILAHAWSELREDEEFTDVISFDTSDTVVVRRRFERIHRALAVA